jgi:DNA-binding transcriptional LysR family regulator
MNIRHLRFFVALSREGHYGRAAAACNVTQPTLSEAIRQLERELAVPLIDRNGRRFGGLTPEGGRILGWAQEILANEDALRQELGEIHGNLAGELRVGVVPAALPVTPLLTSLFHRRHRFVILKILSCTSREIERGLEAGSLDGGLTYTENEPLRYVRTYALYRERYMLLTPARAPYDRMPEVTWREAAELPLCLLTRDMQNRRIIDRLLLRAAPESPRSRSRQTRSCRWLPTCDRGNGQASFPILSSSCWGATVQHFRDCVRSPWLRLRPNKRWDWS